MSLSTRKGPFGLFWALVWLTLTLIIIQIAAFAMHFGEFLGAGTLLHQKDVAIPFSVVPEILWYFSGFLFVHFAYLCLIWGLARLLGKALSLSWNKTFYLGIGLWGLATVGVFLANQVYFPGSLFARLSSAVFTHDQSTILLFIIAGLIACLVFIVLAALLVKFAKHAFKTCLLVLFFLTGIALFFTLQSNNKVVHAKQFTSPNIFIIGLDSLRPDHTGLYGAEKSLIPKLDNFLEDSTYFTHAYSTLARTFPAWVSILTGQFPKENGARYDLIDVNKITLKNTLPQLLQHAGYETTYGTDDNRFAYVDEKFGFDNVIGTKLGFNDFLLGGMTDFPLTNLIANTSVGRFLFYYHYGNRAAYITYHPFTFSNMLSEFINKPKNKPLFMAVHFCLPHWPYAWAPTPSSKFPPKDNAQKHELYKQSIRAVDKQAFEFIETLNDRGLLENSIVLVLSDHAETFGLEGEGLLRQENYKSKQAIQNSPLLTLLKISDPDKLPFATGHGTDVLSLKQHQIVLAYQVFGKERNQSKAIHTPASLIDIKPTLLALAGVSDKNSTGLSFADEIKGKDTGLTAERPLYIESGFTPSAILTTHPSIKDLISIGFEYFRVEPHTNRMVIKDKMGQWILDSKQRVMLYGDWALAFYPTEGKPLPVLVNIKTGQWTDDMNSDFAKNSPVNELRDTMISFYNGEL